MMLRKRTSFKPNLIKAGSTAPAVPSKPAIPTTPSATTAPAVPTAPEPLITTPVPVIPVSAPSSGPTAESTLQDVMRLTGLRNSAYKNVKLKDLLFFNPPPTKDQKRHKKNARKRVNEEHSNETLVEVDVEADAQEPSLVPKVKLGPSGQLILDESSTLINRKNPIKAQEAIVEDNDETVSRTSYDSYRRKPTLTSQAKWSIEDTQKFYHALTILGTDFSMMESLMFSGHRSRTELHKKFKREERINKTKIDVALSNRISLNSEELDGLKDIL